MKISNHFLIHGVTQTTPCHVTEGRNARVLPYKYQSRTSSISPHLQHVHSGYTARRGTSCLPTVMRRRRVSCVLWQQTTNIGTVKPSLRANLICDAIWQAF